LSASPCQSIKNYQELNDTIMKPSKFLKITGLPLLFFFSAFVISCNDENRLTLKDSQDIAEDALTDSYFEDADDMSSLALQSDAATSGGATAASTRQISVSDTRFCAGVVVNITMSPNSTPTVPVGTITIDFGAGCTDPRGNVRTGLITISFTGRRFQPGSTVVWTTTDYTVNGVQLEGTRTLTNISGSTEESPKFQIELENGKATFPDGSVATREASFTRTWIRAASPVNDELRLDGNAAGTNRNGVAYTMVIQETLVFKRGCGFPVSGVKIYTKEGKQITIDYGDGSCDRQVTYTVGDQTITTNVGNN
jgi:hypothetical protein